MSPARLGVTRFVVSAAAILVLCGCGTAAARHGDAVQHGAGMAADEKQAQIVDGYRVQIATGGGESTNGIWHARTTGCQAFLWISAEVGSGAGVCLRKGVMVKPSVRCEAGNIVIEAQPRAEATGMMLEMSNGQKLASSVIRVSLKDGAMLKYYYQVVPNRGPVPRTLDEVTGRSESARRIPLPAGQGCGGRELGGHPTKPPRRSPKGPGTTYES